MSMEKNGTISRWDDDKGFGFIRPQAGGTELFLHISDFRGDRRPQEGDAVCFVPGSDREGRARATHARLAGLAIDMPEIRRRPQSTATRAKALEGRSQVAPPRRNPWPRALAMTGALLLLPLAGLLHWLSQGHALWPLLAYPLFSLVCLFAYWRDKRSAEQGGWRTPEQTLHLLELLGGWPGALIGQQVLRHKTRKVSFQVVFWAIVAAHQLFWIDRLGNGWLVALAGHYSGL